jgi:hypothetical protein
MDRGGDDMTNPLERSLDDMRREKEPGEMVIDDAEVDELERFGALLSTAFDLSGEPPPLAAIEFAQSSVTLPERSAEHIAQFNKGVRQRIDRALQDATGAPSIGAWIRRVRTGASFSDALAARAAGVSLPSYRLFEADRMPVWRLPAEDFARFCKRLVIDANALLRWASVATIDAPHGIYGRLDIHEEERSLALDKLGRDSQAALRKAFDEWRHEFISAYDEPSEDAAPERR